ncbi:hypothetical protein P8452_59419 [Trifolium repens]|nr:hypothetical protein P8452_59419 [Trifolium repens]
MNLAALKINNALTNNNNDNVGLGRDDDDGGSRTLRFAHMTAAKESVCGEAVREEKTDEEGQRHRRWYKQRRWEKGEELRW